MAEHFKKGQIIPKRLGMAFTHKKAQSNVTFGCDVVVEGRTIRATSTIECAVICVNAYKGRRRGNGTFQRVFYTFENIHIDAAGFYSGSSMEAKS